MHAIPWLWLINRGVYMDAAELKKAIQNGDFSQTFARLYGKVNQAPVRYCKAIDAFCRLFGDAQLSLFSAPGRTEVGGNHTDHQHGCVLAGSVDLDVIAVVAPLQEAKVIIQSEGYPMDTVDLSALEADPAEEGKAAALIRGMCAYMQKAGYKVGGFKAYTTSNVLKGSGLSSSAAFEVLIGNIISGLFNGGAVEPVEIAQMAQKAENVYFGKPSGLMDQMASAVGGFTAIDFNDPQNPVIESVSFDLAAHDHSLCIVNTGGNHADLTKDYADVTVECKNISAYFGKAFLRDVDEAEIYANIADLRSRFGDRAVLRAIHFFNDSRRAVQEKAALKKNDFAAFLRLVNMSGNSSFKYLQNVYSTSAVSVQGLSLALCLAEQVLNGEGASRVHGGGFAGTIQAFVPNNRLEEFRSVMEAAFGAGQVYVLNIRPVGGTAVKK